MSLTTSNSMAIHRIKHLEAFSEAIQKGKKRTEAFQHLDLDSRITIVGSSKLASKKTIDWNAIGNKTLQKRVRRLLKGAANASFWDARILKEMPKAHPFYKEAIKNLRLPCSSDYDALCHARHTIKTKYEPFKKEVGQDVMIALKNCKALQSLGGESEPSSRLLVREAFPGLCSFSIKPSTLIKDLLLPKHLKDAHVSSKTRKILTYKQHNGSYSAGVIGGRRFYVIGEKHNGLKDLEFQKLATRSAGIDRIALFLEGLKASDMGECIFKMNRRLPQQALCCGLESSNMLAYLLQSLAMARATATWDKQGALDILCMDIAQFPNNVFDKRPFILEKVWKTYSIHYPKAGRLVRKLADTPEIRIKEDIRKLQELWKANSASLNAYFNCFLTSFLNEPGFLNIEEYKALQSDITKPSRKSALKIMNLFIRKRDTDFVQNILKKLPSIPTSRPIVIVVGSAHVWGVFRKLQELYHRNPKK